MKEEMKRYGFTQRNLYTKENRKKKMVGRHLYQTTKGESPLWEEAEPSKVVYVTEELAKIIPDTIYMASTFDNSRIVFETEEDLLKNKNALFGTVGPNRDEEGVPHLLFDEELN